MATMQAAWQVGKTDAPLPPKVKANPLLGVALELQNDPLAYLVQKYHEHGAIFRAKLLNREITFIAGIEANRFLATDGNAIFSSERLFGTFGRELGTETFMVAMDGPEHKHLRKLERRGYSRSAMMPHLDRLLAIVDDFSRELKAGDSFAILPTLQYLVTQQLGIIVADRTPDDYFGDLQRLLNYNLNVHVLKMWPTAMLYTPQYRRSKRRVMELGADVLETHRQKPDDSDKPRNLIDDLLAAKDLNGQPYTEDMLLASTIGPYFAGIDTVASSLAFFLYATLKHPHVKAESTREADVMYADGVPKMHDMKDMEMIHGAAIETLRMYPVAPMTPRVNVEPFEFMGHRVEADSDVYVAQTVTHYLEEFYPDPYTFDPMRFAKQGRGAAHAFAPFTLGDHLCLGAGVAEMQMILILSRLIHNLDLELVGADEPLKIYAAPLPNIGRKMSVRVVKNRMQ